MSSINLQFHATREEVIELIKKSQKTFNLYMIAIKLFPIFKWELISIDEFDDKITIIKESDMVFISISEPYEIPDKYINFLDKNKNSFVFYLGEQEDNLLKESSMGTITEDIEILKIWKEIINKYKKTLLKGAWLINPETKEKIKFYKNHYYTAKAQKAFQDGCQISPIAGWYLYNLSQDL